MSLRPAIFMAGTPYPEVTGLDCRVPSHGLHRDALGFSPRDTCVSSRYERRVGLDAFFTGTRIQPKPASASPIAHSPGSHHYDTPPVSALEHSGINVRPIPMLDVEQNLCGAGILTCFPFACLD